MFYQQSSRSTYDTDCPTGGGAMTFPNGMPTDSGIVLHDTASVLRVRFEGGSSQLVKYVGTHNIEIRYNDVDNNVVNVVREFEILTDCSSKAWNWNTADTGTGTGIKRI
jgi:hypothetical protein